MTNGKTDKVIPRDVEVPHVEEKRMGEKKWGRLMFIGSLMVFATFAVAGAFLFTEKTTNFKGNNDAMAVVAHFISQDGIKLNGTIGGKATLDGSVHSVEIYIIPKKSSVNLLEFDLAAKLNTSDDEQHAITMVDSRAYYSILNNTSGDLMAQECMENADIVALDKLSESLMNGNVLSETEVSNHLEELMDCKDGKLVGTEWILKDYAYCIKTDASNSNTFISRIGGENLVVDVKPMTATEASEVKAMYISKPFPVIYNVLGEATECPKLNVFGNSISYNRYLKTNIPSQAKDLASKGNEWYKRKSLSNHHGASTRMLQEQPDFTVEYTEEELLEFYYSVHVLGCTSFCVDANIETAAIDITEMETFLVAYNGEEQYYEDFRRLSNDANNVASVTLPRPCVFLTGSGYRPMWDNVLDAGYDNGYNVEEVSWKRSSFVNSIYGPNRYDIGIAPGHEGWGEIFKYKPCYCLSMYFAELDTYTSEWYNLELQNMTALTIVGVSLGARDNHSITEWPLLVNDKMLELGEDQYPIVENTIIFSHYTSSMTVAAALHSGMLRLGSSSKWITIHSPVTGIAYEDPGADTRATLCKKSHVEQMIEKNNLDIKYKKLEKEKLAGGLKVKAIIEACSPYEDKTGNLKWIKSLNPASFPTDVTEVFNGAQQQLALRVDAALCGKSDVGMLSTKHMLNQYTKELGFGHSNGQSDGIIPLENCLALMGLKAEYAPEQEMSWSTDPANRFYEANVHNRDIEMYQDGVVDGTAQYRTWMENLRLHVDLGKDKNVLPLNTAPVLPPSSDTQLYIKRFESYTFDDQEHGEVTVPYGFKIISGGATASPWGNILTSYPRLDSNGKIVAWVADLKNEEYKWCTFYRYAYAIYDPNNEWDIKVSLHDKETVDKPSGYTLIGGGAFYEKDLDNYKEPLQSFPLEDLSGWSVKKYDDMTVYAIGIKSNLGKELDCSFVEGIDFISYDYYPMGISQAQSGKRIVAGGMKHSNQLGVIQSLLISKMGQLFLGQSQTSDENDEPIEIHTIQCTNVAFVDDPSVIPFYQFAQLGEECGAQVQANAPSVCDNSAICHNGSCMAITPTLDPNVALAGEQCRGDKKYDGPTECNAGKTCEKVSKNFYICQ